MEPATACGSFSWIILKVQVGIPEHFQDFSRCNPGGDRYGRLGASQLIYQMVSMPLSDKLML